jgi:phosphatidylglycerophosphate synthase
MLSPQELREVAQAGKDRDPGWYRIHRRLSIQVTARIVQSRVTLNQISGLMLSLGVIGAACNAASHLAVNAVGWACLYGAFLLDKVDGEVARVRGQQSVIGILLDRFHHRLV